MGLVSAMLNVKKNDTKKLVAESVDNNLTGFDESTRLGITGYISDRFLEGTHRPHLNDSIKDLSVIFNDGLENTLASEKNEDYEKKISELLEIVKEKEAMNNDMALKIQETVDAQQISHEQAEKLEGLRETIKDQGVTISSLRLDVYELSKCRTKVSEKDAEISQKSELWNREREQLTRNIEAITRSRDDAISAGRNDLENNQRALESYKSSRNAQTEKDLVEYTKALEEKSSHLKRLDDEKKALETRIQDLDEKGVRILGEKQELETETRSLMESLSQKNAHVASMDSEIKRLTKENEEYDEILKENMKNLQSCISEKKEIIYNDSLREQRHISSMKEKEEELSKIRDHLNVERAVFTERNELREKDNKNLSQRNILLSTSIEELERSLKQKDDEIRETRSVRSATEYILASLGSRDPEENGLRKLYGHRLLIKKPSSSSQHVPMRLESGSRGKMDPEDLELFWEQVLKKKKKDPIMVVRVGDTDVRVSLKSNSVFKTWTQVREMNACRFTVNGSIDLKGIHSKEFLLLLYIIHEEGLHGDDGELLIPPGRRASPGSAFSLSDMFYWM